MAAPSRLSPRLRLAPTRCSFPMSSDTVPDVVQALVGNNINTKKDASCWSSGLWEVRISVYATAALNGT